MKENEFQSRVVRSLFYQGAWTFNVHGHGMQRPGVPDLLVVHRSWKGWLELKVGKNKPSAIQCKVMQDNLARGFPCYVLRSNGVITLETLEGEIWEVELRSLIKELVDVGEQRTV